MEDAEDSMEECLSVCLCVWRFFRQVMEFGDCNNRNWKSR